MVDNPEHTSRPISQSFSIPEFLQKGGVFIGLTLVLLIAAIISPVFYKPENIFNVLRQGSALGIVSIGQAIVILGGGFDLSVAAVMQLAVITSAELAQGREQYAVPVILTCIVMGAVVGFANGLIVIKRRVQPFVATLFVAVIIVGIRMAYTGGAPSGQLPPVLRYFGRDSTWAVPNATLIFFLLAAVAFILLRYTVFGRRIYAMGGNREVARLSAINVDRLAILSYVVCGTLASVAGLILAGYIGYADQWIGAGYDLDSIAAAVVGGVSLAGGRGGIAGTVAGVLLITILLNIVLLLNLDAQYQYIVRGFVILLAVALYSIRGRA
jgi:ribose/xylose/arabinose/galactoside ABC-type transport system permease subunit